LYKFAPATAAETDTLTELAGGGSDRLDFSALTTGVTVNLTSDTATATMANRTVKTSTAGGSSSANIDNVTGGSGADRLTGNAAANSLSGGAGIDTLAGGAGNDTLIGGADNDLYQFAPASAAETDTVSELAGGGSDRLDFSALTTSVNVNLNSDTGIATMLNRTVKTAQGGQAANFESATGGSGADRLTGNAAANALTGNAGNDTSTGNAGNDSLVGGADNDTYTFAAVTGGTAETDVITELAGGGTDTLDFSALGSAVPVTINLGSDTALATHANRTVKTAAAGQAQFIEKAAGGAAADTLTGNNADNRLSGNAGVDVINGSGGTDTIDPGDGAPVETIVDNTAATLTGTWFTSTGVAGFYGPNYVYDGDAGKGTKTAKFAPQLPAAGYYTVYTRWTAAANRAAAVPVDIQTATNKRTVLVNQQANNGVWVSLGTYKFNAAGSSVLFHTDGTTGQVVADAVRFVPAATPATITVDNTDAGVTVTGAWTASTNTPGFVGTNYLSDGNTGTAAVKKSVKYSLGTISAGVYELFGIWTAGANRASNVFYDITGSTGSLRANVDQRTNNGVWVSLGFFSLGATGAAITIRNDNANGYVIADAVRVVNVS